MAIESKMHRGPIGSKAQKSGFPTWVWFVLLVLVLAGLGAWFYFGGESEPSSPSVELTEELTTDEVYQAVFLDNGQVYFGSLERGTRGFFTLSDVFYLQSGVSIDQSSNVALAKLGNEAHGPEDEMEINVDHILFIENMRSDSPVVQAILEYKRTN